ncbi:putative disease resistance protein [Camellia lanceoleosa]|uniref:Disease resistance protein n=1 Tax=Camellia lanceoleosa TaxID=1840588 RepID=A0ACC0GLG4_9ERIC|nr:putative disease resistance protein [Camellia lanceoleosa]
MDLCQSFAQQLYLLSTAEEFEEDDYDGEEDEEEEEEIEQDLRQKISEELAQKHFLIILNDKGKKMKEKDIMPKLETLLNLNQESSYKVLITTNNHRDNNIMDSLRSVIEKLEIALKEITSGERFDIALLLRCGFDMLPGAIIFCRKIDNVLELRGLTALEVSGPSSLQMIPDDLFGGTSNLQSLNLSALQIESLPSSLYDLSELSWLILRECSRLISLQSLRHCRNLVVLDLSGATSFKYFKDRNFSQNKELQMLNFSETKIKSIPLISGLEKLTHLLLNGCIEFERLCGINLVTSLQVLDLSDARNFREFHDRSLENIIGLKILDLSGTSVDHLPSNISNPHHLYLNGCTQLDNLSCVELFIDLETLCLSKAQVKSLPSLPHLYNLRWLLLSCCSNLEELPYLNSLAKLKVLDLSDLRTVPDLKELTKLKVLDLSETAVDDLLSLDNFTNLHQLLLRDCPGLEEFLQLEMLDLLEATLDKLPYGISELTHLKRLDLPSMKDTQGIGKSNMKELYQYGWDISSFLAKTVGDNNNPSVSVTGSQFLQLLENNLSLWETSFKQFHFSVHAFEEQDGKGVVSFYRDDFIFRDIYFKARHLFDFEEQRSFEIRGFHHSPKGIEGVLSHADCLFFIDNTFGRWLSNLGTTNCKVLKSYFIDRSREMVSVFHGEKVEELVKLKILEVLWVSNSVNLELIYPQDWQSVTFQNLKQLYLDCCPKLSIVFLSSQLPINLQVLQIKFCDGLEAVFEEASPKPKLRNTLYLWELPELKSIGCVLPSLLTLTVWGCPNLAEFEENVKLPRSP